MRAPRPAPISALAALAWAALASSVVADDEPPFRGPLVYVDHAQHFDLGDLDGDGALDMVTAELGTRSFLRTPAVLRVHRNAGDGTFSTLPDRYGDVAPDERVVPILADLDGDGRLDVATVWQALETVTVDIGQGDGTFVAGVEEFVSETLLDLGVADLDGDGHLDVAVTRRDTTRLVAMYGDGRGAFRERRQVDLKGVSPSLETDRRIALGDLERDGFVDVVVTSGRAQVGGTLSVRRGTGGGLGLPGFGPVESHDAGTTPNAMGPPRILDLDDDGDLDVAVMTDNVALGFPASDPPGLGPPVELGPYANFQQDVDLAMGDMDEDGSADRVFAATISNIEISHGPDYESRSDFRLGPSSRFVRLADLDRDGDLDVVTLDSGLHGNGAGVRETGRQIRIALGDGAGGFRAFTSSLEDDFPHIGENHVADLDGDGRTDLLTRNAGISHGPYDRFVLRRGRALGGFHPPEVLDTPRTESTFRIADLDRDGLLDVIALRAGDPFPRTRFYAGLGDGTFGDVKPGDVQAITVVDWSLGDVDGDGRLDLVLEDRQGSPASDDALLVFRGLGTGRFELAPASTLVLGFDPLAFDVEDVDGDGRDDVVVIRLDEVANLWLFLGRDDGSLQYVPTPDLPGVPDAIVLADWNGDGRVDLAATTRETDVRRLALLPGTPGGGLGPPTILGDLPSLQPISHRRPVPADVDGDGHLDLVVTGGEIDVLLGDGRGGFGPARRASADTERSHVVDVTGDGLPDLLGVSRFLLSVSSNRLGPWRPRADGLPGSLGIPRQELRGAATADSLFERSLSDARPGGVALWVVGASDVSAPFRGGVLVPSPDLVFPSLPLDGEGSAVHRERWAPLPPGLDLYAQWWTPDPAGPFGWAASNAYAIRTF